MWWVAVEYLGDLPDAGFPKMFFKARKESFDVVLAFRIYPSVRIDKTADQPAPNRSLVIRRIPVERGADVIGDISVVPR